MNSNVTHPEASVTPEPQSVDRRPTGMGTSPVRPLGRRTRTLPEQIADELGARILNGEYRAGERVGEQQLAEAYVVSRGPIREAIRMLAGRGLVELLPRRGAFVVDISLDTIADVFNVRATLLGLAARCFARLPAPRGLAELFERSADVQAMARDHTIDPISFARAIGRTGTALYRHCGNRQLTRMLESQAQGSLWGLIWRERPLDFLTPERRAQAAAQWAAIPAAIQAGRDEEAERLIRAALFDSRDHALRILQQHRGETVHPSRQFRDR
jgi:DNA-binding GntR family transcriptional regulator